MKLRQFGGLTLTLALLASVGAGAGDPAPRTLARNKPAEAAETLDAFLAGAPALQEHLVWTTGDGKREPFDQWTPAKSATGVFLRQTGGGRAQPGDALADRGQG